MPVHTASTVVQYSARDTCAAFEELGWETRILKMSHSVTDWQIAKAINEFKPDVLIFINHLRPFEENTPYPKNLMFVTWIQDAIPEINRHDTAQKWNEMVKRKECLTEENKENNDKKR